MPYYIGLLLLLSLSSSWLLRRPIFGVVIGLLNCLPLLIFADCIMIVFLHLFQWPNSALGLRFYANIHIISFHILKANVTHLCFHIRYPLYFWFWLNFQEEAEKKIKEQILDVLKGKPYEMHVIRDIIFIENDPKQRKSEDTKVKLSHIHKLFCRVNTL